MQSNMSFLLFHFWSKLKFFSLSYLNFFSKYFNWITWFTQILLDINYPLPIMYLMFLYTTHLIEDTTTLSCSAIILLNFLGSWLMMTRKNSAVLIISDQNVSFSWTWMTCPCQQLPGLTLNIKDLIIFKKADYLQFDLINGQSCKHSRPFYFLCQIGSCNINTFDMFEREMGILKFDAFCITLCCLSFMIKMCS